MEVGRINILICFDSFIKNGDSLVTEIQACSLD